MSFGTNLRADVVAWVDAFFAIGQILTGTKYPSKELTRWLRRRYRSMRSSHPETSRNEAIYLVASMRYVLESVHFPEKKHQYSRLIDDINGRADLDFAEVAFQLARIQHGVVGIENSDIEILRRNIENELKDLP